MSHKTLIIVHGMGEHNKNATVKRIVENVCGVIKARGDDSKSVELSGILEHGAPASITLKYGNETWRFVEYWWAQEFIRPKLPRLAQWVTNRMRAHLLSLWHSLQRALSDVRPTPASLRDPFIARLYQAVAIPIYMLGVLIIWALTPLILLVTVLLSTFSWFPPLHGSLKLFQQLLAGFAIDYLGDIFIYFKDDVQGPQLRGGLERMITEVGNEEDNEGIVLLAHSAGAPIAYEALSVLNESVNPDERQALNKVHALITVGAILNMSWNLGLTRFQKPIPSNIRWYNLWTHYDYGATGPILKDEKPWLNESNFVNRRVDNTETLFLDHTSYWGNNEQLTTLILEELGGLDTSNDFWRGPYSENELDWRRRSSQAWKDWDLRRGTVAWRAFWGLPLMLAPTIGFAVALVFHSITPQPIIHFGEVLISSLVDLAQIQWPDTGNLTDLSGWMKWIGISAILTAVAEIAWLLIFLVYVFLFWRPWVSKLRHRRDAEFKNWRNSARAQSKQG
ncbi:MAG: hypothetical protein IIC24_05715 [Chloroflexi bacterium]|nr:hypothetical protein [Chloroflexota bacterium]